MSPPPRSMVLPFRLKVALLTATCAALPLLPVGWLLIDVNEREVETSVRELQIALTGEVARAIEADAEAAEHALGAVAGALTDASLEDRMRLDLALRLIDAEPALPLVAVYDHRGHALDRLRPPEGAEAETPERLPAPLMREAEAEGRALEAARSSSEGPRTLLVMPLRAEGGQRTGFVAAPLSLGAVQARVERLSGGHGGDRGQVLVVDEARRLLAHPNLERARALDRARELPEAIDPATLDARAATSAELFDEGDEGGRAWVGTAVGLRSRPWAVVALVPRDVAYASIGQMRRIVLITIALALLGALAIALIFARRIAAPIGALVAFTKELAARRFDRRVVIDTGDELSTLGEALSGAAEALERSESRIREEIEIRADLGRYLPAELVDKIVRREQSMELGGRRAQITVLFADVVAFTPLSESLSPEQVVALLNELFTLMTEAVFRHEGTVDKFVGDSVMAIWGAPAEQPDHAERALRAARDMLRFLEVANAGWEARFGARVRLAIGVNSGEAVVGNVGSSSRMEYTAIGDVVNTAARLESIARPQQILITRATAEAAGEAFEVREVGSREVPGRSAPVELFEVGW